MNDTPKNSSPILEPNFEGEEMKLPANISAQVTEPTNNTLLTGPIIILLFAILLALLGGIYYWYTILMAEPLVTPTPTRPTTEMNNEPESTTAEARTAATDVVSTSDELDAIRADVESTTMEPLETDFAAVESELGGALEATPTE